MRVASAILIILCLCLCPLVVGEGFRLHLARNVYPAIQDQVQAAPPASESPNGQAEPSKEQTLPAGKEPSAEPKTDAKTEPNSGSSGSNDKADEPANPSGVEPKAKPQTETKKDGKDATGGSARRRRTAKHAATPPADGTPKKVVVREGGATEPSAQIVAGMTPEEANRKRVDSEQLLTATDRDLAQIAQRTLDAQQQETFAQIRNYVEVARSALKEGDIARAHTLAEKASLLAQDLTKH